MARNTQEFWSDLVAQSENVAINVAMPMANLAIENPAYADPAIETLCLMIEEHGPIDMAGEALEKLIPHYPDASVQALEQLSMMSQSEKVRLRVDSCRALGWLGAVTDADSELIAELLADRLAGEDFSIARSALWGLTKIAITDPEAVQVARDDLVTALAPNFEDIPQEALGYALYEVSTVRLYAAEALAALSAGDTIDDPSLPTENLDERSHQANLAAWAIQHASDELDIGTQEEKVWSVTSDEERHGIADPLCNELRTLAEDGNAKHSVPALFGLGYIATGNDDLQWVFEYLDTVAERDDGVRADAVRAIFRSGPVAYGKQSQDDEGRLKPDRKPCTVPDGVKGQELTLTVSEAGVVPGDGKSIQIPKWVAERLGVAEMWSGIAVCGTECTVATTNNSYQVEGCNEVKLDRHLRDRIGVSPGEEVTVTPTDLIPARKVMLAVPDESPLSVSDSTIQSVFNRMPVTEDDVITTDVVTDAEAVQRYDVFDYLSPDDKEKHRQVFKPFPFRVVSVEPQDANLIVGETIIGIEPDMDAEITDWWGSKGEYAEGDVVFVSDIELKPETSEEELTETIEELSKLREEKRKKNGNSPRER